MKILLSNSSLEAALWVTAAFTVLGSCLVGSKLLGFHLQCLPVVGQEAVADLDWNGILSHSFAVCLGQQLKVLSPKPR